MPKHLDDSQESSPDSDASTYDFMVPISLCLPLKKWQSNGYKYTHLRYILLYKKCNVVKDSGGD